MSKRKKLSQYQKDRRKEIVVKILLVFGLVFQITTLIIMSCMKDNRVIIMLSLFVVGSVVLLLIIYSIGKTIKTSKRKEKYEYIEYTVDPNLNLKEKFANIGIVKQSGFRDCDYYVSFTTKPDLFSKDLVVVANIEVDCNYTKKEYKQFINSIPELYKSTREEVNEDYTSYEREIFLVIFIEKEKCQFVCDYIKRSFCQWGRFNPLIVYNKEKSTIKLLKTGEYDDVIAKKYIKKIFNLTSKPRVIIESNKKK
ncbi:MAG: hypothetical protein J6C23_09185 [Clostridia bacterium]|nr:hypothetical protein [Clostridia bacterium]